MNLSEHFTLEEMVLSQTASRQGIDNTPPDEVVTNLRLTAAGLELVRSLLLNPITISSGYRCKALNSFVGGAINSAHLSGFAADFICPAFGSPLTIIEALIAPGSMIKFDQVIEEGTWVHISFDPRMRGMVLTAKFTPGLPTSYQEGLAPR